MIWHEIGYDPSACGEAVLLLGNGLNWAGHGPSWSALLNELKKETGYPDPLDEATPFPLVYEEMVLHALRHGGSERAMLNVVAEHTKGIPVAPLLTRLNALPIRHLLTTNYDLATEVGFLGGEGASAAPVRESRYSLFRRKEEGDRVIWPIHGEAGVIDSIMLGYEHYSGYLEQMRRYVTRAVRYQKKTQQSLVKSLGAPSGLDRIRSWVDFFFTKHVVIAGLSLDFQELHLWWLLTYRARRRAEGKRFAENGRITFIHGPPAEPTGKDDVAAILRKERAERVHRLLRAAGVNLVEVTVTDPVDRRTHYNAVLDEVESTVGST